MEQIIEINNRDFLVVKEFDYNENIYIYAIAVDGSNELALLRQFTLNNEIMIESVNDEEQIKEILKYMNELK